jgi:hypothetical protein
MNFRFPTQTAGQPNYRDTFQLAPTPSTVAFSQVPEPSDRRPCSNDLDAADFADDLKMHPAQLYQ